MTNITALRLMDARALEFDDNSFDHVSALHIMSVVPEPKRVMAEMAHVLCPGGTIVMVNHFARDLCRTRERCHGWSGSSPRLPTVWAGRLISTVHRF